MMGMVYTELLEMIEARFSFDMVDAVLERSGASGSYTSVGDYADEELVGIVVALSEETQTPVSDLLYAYGEYLGGRFVELFPAFFNAHTSALEFLKGLESHVHTEVRKLYPNAKPPLFAWTTDEDAFLLTYHSERGLWKFAEGLLTKCLNHYGDSQYIQDIVDHSGGAGTHVEFRLAVTP